MTWLPEGFETPARLDLPTGHHLRPIREGDVDIDYPAVMGSRERLWARYGDAWGWPPATMTFEADREDLARHEREIEAQETFNFAVLDEAETELLGCVYIDPPEEADRAVGADAVVSWWVVDAHAGEPLQHALDDAVPRWLRDVWRFANAVVDPPEPGDGADPFGGRAPTSHERQSGVPWDASYHEGPAPWDVGRPQPAVVRLAAEGAFTGAVLDAGCGTGDNALHLASLGLPVLGIDVAATALALARERAHEAGVDLELAEADAFQLAQLGRRFDTVLDSGLFHTFDADERRRYAASLASVTEPGGTLYVLCFSDGGPDTGPHPITQDDLRAAFDAGSGWSVVAIEPDRIHTRYHADGAPAWVATIRRI